MLSLSLFKDLNLEVYPFLKVVQLGDKNGYRERILETGA